MTNNAYTYGQQVESSSELTQMWLRNVLRHNSRTIKPNTLWRPLPDTKHTTKRKESKKNEMKMSSTGSRLLKIQFNWNQLNNIDEKGVNLSLEMSLNRFWLRFRLSSKNPKIGSSQRWSIFLCLVRSSDKTWVNVPTAAVDIFWSKFRC